MYYVCEKHSHRKACKVTAKLYYKAVRLAGKLGGKRKRDLSLISSKVISTNTTNTTATTPTRLGSRY
jgi:hypothetical protein